MPARETPDLQAILCELESWQDSSVTKQRKFSRFMARGEARLLPGEANVHPQDIPAVHIRDISRGGIGVLTTRRMELNEFFQVQLSDREVVSATLPGFCRFCREVMPDIFLCGIAFGIDASVLLSLGVPAKELARQDGGEDREAVSGDFVDPSSLLEDEAA